MQAERIECVDFIGFRQLLLTHEDRHPDRGRLLALCRPVTDGHGDRALRVTHPQSA